MISLPLSTTSAVFAPPPRGAEFDFGGTGYSYGNFVVYNASVFLSIKKGSTQGQSTWGPEFAIGPSALQIAAGAPAGARPHGSDLIFGVRARSYSSDQPWSASKTYAIGDTVVVANVAYVATAASTNQQPPNAAFWTVISATVFGAFFQPGEVSLSATSQTASSISGGGVVNPCPCGSGGMTGICDAVQSCQWIELDTVGPAAGPDGFGFEIKDTTDNGVNIENTANGGVTVTARNAGPVSIGAETGGVAVSAFSEISIVNNGSTGTEVRIANHDEGGIDIRDESTTGTPGGITIVAAAGAGIDVRSDDNIRVFAGSQVEVFLSAGKMLEVFNSVGHPIFEVREDGSLHGLTGQSLTFDL